MAQIFRMRYLYPLYSFYDHFFALQVVLKRGRRKMTNLLLYINRKIRVNCH